MKKATNVNSVEFNSKVLDAGSPVLVDFWAPWCGPCRALAPILDEVAADFDGTMDVYKVDIEAEPDVAARFGVQTVPVLILFKGGEEIHRRVGTLSRTQLTAIIEQKL
ncbi:Thioredoxin-1 [Nitrospirillum viridazoti Y2]|uniref:Thioredoxin n=1 Tax=Nitrospirillum amazonense TaxID=28077 RepID=A0A560IUF9_9PROT|nr:thioredoxin [Nitrospirillum amazonense]EGX99436.1 Thioredoxin-1 [Nitrospirillum amazonense Y2]TWB60614.1 thioredoxin [Nitrospirillum amazonense]